MSKYDRFQKAKKRFYMLQMVNSFGLDDEERARLDKDYDEAEREFIEAWAVATGRKDEQ